MKRVLQIVDDLHYVRTNCYQSQLLKSSNEVCDLTTVPVFALQSIDPSSFETIVSTLKLRTIDRVRNELSLLLKGRNIVVYDQDPFESCRNDGSHFGAHERIASTLNVEKFVVTTKKYAEHMNSKGLRTNFARIWMRPELCRIVKPWNERSIDVAFMGSMHPWRKILVDSLELAGIRVKVGTNSKSYHDYLNDLQDVKIFVCSHDSRMLMDGVVQNSRHGMYHKDVEVASQGCFSISDRSDESSTYVEDDMNSIVLYDDANDVPSLIESIKSMDSGDRKSMIDRTVNSIREFDRWKETAKILCF